MSKEKYVVWVKEHKFRKPKGSGWEEQGDGAMTLKQAERVARELKQDFPVLTKVLPAGVDPNR